MAFCPYCANDFETLTIEHVIPQELGGNLEIDACRKCNGDAALHVDGPVQKLPPVRILRGLYDVRSPKHRGKPPGVQIAGSLAQGGGKALFRPGRLEADLVQVAPAEPVLNADGSYTIATPVKDADKHLKRALERLQREHPDKTVEVVDSERRPGDVKFEYGWDMKPWIWPRFAAKVGLGLGHLAMGKTFSTSRPAWMLRGLFRQGSTYKGMFPPGYELPCFAVELENDALVPGLLLPHEHLVGIRRVAGGLEFFGYLYGELGFGVQLATTDVPTDGACAWLLDGAGRSPVKGPLDTVVGLLAERADLFGSTHRFRRDHPRSQFNGVAHRARVA